jgi:hypothetical protein
VRQRFCVTNKLYAYRSAKGAQPYDHVQSALKQQLPSSRFFASIARNAVVDIPVYLR